MTEPPAAAGLERLTRICLTLPQAEREFGGQHARFLVRGKTFAYYLNDHHGDGMIAVCCKAPAGMSAALIDSDPVRFYRPAYLGVRGWVSLRLDLDAIDWAEVSDLVTGSYRLTAPKRLAAQITPPPV